MTGENGDKEAFSTILTREFGVLPSGDRGAVEGF